MSNLIVLLALVVAVSSDKAYFELVIKSLREAFHLREMTLVYNEKPVLEAASCHAVTVHKFASAAGFRMNFLDIDKGVDLLDFSIRSAAITTVLLALPDALARSVIGQVMKTNQRKVIQLIVMSADPESYLHFLYLPMDSQVLFIQCCAERMSVKEVYHIHQFGPLIIHNLSLFPEELHRNSGFWKRRSDLRGLTLKAASNNDVRFFDSQDVMEAFNYDVWDTIEKNLNFSTQLFPAPEQGVGALTGNGSWTGMIGMLQRNEADLAKEATTITRERTLVADFTNVYWQTGTYAYVRWPTTSYVSNMWCFGAVMLMTVVGATLALILTAWLMPEQGVEKLCLIFDVFCSFCQQGVEGAQWPRCCSARMVIAVTQLAGFLVCGIYSATLMSRLAVRTRAHDYQSFAGIVNSSTYAVGFTRGGSSIEMMKPQLQKLNLRDYQLEYNFTHAMERVCQEEYIFVMGGIPPRTKVSCKADLVKVKLGACPISLAMRKDSPYRDIINKQLLKLLEAGEVTRLRRKWSLQEDAETRDPESITLKHVTPCVVSLVVGVAASAACLLAERHFAREDAWARP